MLRMCRHRITSEYDDNSGDDVPSGLTIVAPGKPETKHSRSPPDNSHSGVLNVVVFPVLPPAVFGNL